MIKYWEISVTYKNNTFFFLPMKHYFLLLSFLFILLTACHNSDIVTIHTATTDIPVQVEIADSAEEHAIGLMFRTELADNSGMLFVFDDMQQRGFWMKNTKIPLDIIFIDSEGVIVDIKENFQPCTTEECGRYYSKPAQYALEVNAGFVAENSVEIGNIIII